MIRLLNIFSLFFSLGFLPQASANGNPFTVDTPILLNFLTYDDGRHESRISEVIEARMQAFAFSTGSQLQPWCFKTYKVNPPFAAQTESYTVQKNLVAGVRGTQVSISGLSPLIRKIEDVVEDKVFFDCSIENSSFLMIKGHLASGQTFQSNVSIYLLGNNLVLQTGGTKLSLSELETSVPLVPSVFLDDNWNVLWEDLDPQDQEFRRNF